MSTGLIKELVEKPTTNYTHFHEYHNKKSVEIYGICGKKIRGKINNIWEK